MSAAEPWLPADCRGLLPDDPLVRIWNARPDPPDSAALFLQAAGLIFDWVAAGAAAGQPWRASLDGHTGDLYGGLPGVAIFAAAYAAATGRAEAAALAEQIALELAGRPAEGRPLGGAAVGLGGEIFSLLKLAETLGRPPLAERAIELGAAAAASPAATPFDVIGGRSGSILVLDLLIAAARELRPAAAAGLRDRLAAEARQLAASSSLVPGGRAFAGAGERPASGFAHGASGAALALARASRHAEIPSLPRILGEILSFERSLYLPAAGNWLPWPGEERLNPIGWCRGAPGIALARLGLLAAGAEPAEELRADLAQALRSTLALPPQPLDHLCCGNLSRVETLLSAHKLSAAEEDLAAARTIGLYVLRAAKKRSAFSLGSENPDDPSFFQGASGIGYSFLRLALPGRFPSILAFE